MIKNIIFDLGNVLINVHFEKFRADMLKAGVSPQNFEKLFHSKFLKDKFESGSISNREFTDLMSSKLGPGISKKKFIEIFNDMFTEIPEMRKYIERIAKEGKYRLILLSNTNSFHYNYCKRQFDYLKYFHTTALSYKLKMLKPSSIIYETVLKRYKLKAGETVFIDDLEENCKGAQEIGIKTICYKDFKSFKLKLDKLKNLK